MGSGDGKRAAVGDAVAAAAREIEARDRAAAGEQVPMFPVPTRHTGARADHLQGAIEAQRRRAGRPPGAQNRSTARMREYFLARGADPLQALVAWGLHTPTSLAAELGCSRLEAFRELRNMWEAAAPFFYAKQAPVDDDGKPVPFFNLVVGGQHAHVAAASVPWIYEGGPVEQNQGVSEEPAAVSHTPISHEGDK